MNEETDNRKPEAERQFDPVSLLGRIRALKAKAAAMQSAIDACDGHVWKTDYVSQITASGGSCVCVRCGERRAWKDIDEHEPNVLSAP